MVLSSCSLKVWRNIMELYNFSKGEGNGCLNVPQFSKIERSSCANPSAHKARGLCLILIA